MLALATSGIASSIGNQGKASAVFTCMVVPGDGNKSAAYSGKASGIPKPWAQ